MQCTWNTDPPLQYFGWISLWFSTTGLSLIKSSIRRVRNAVCLYGIVDSPCVFRYIRKSSFRLFRNFCHAVWSLAQQRATKARLAVIIWPHPHQGNDPLRLIFETCSLWLIRKLPPSDLFPPIWPRCLLGSLPVFMSHDVFGWCSFHTKWKILLWGVRRCQLRNGHGLCSSSPLSPWMSAPLNVCAMKSWGNSFLKQSTATNTEISPPLAPAPLPPCAIPC